MKEPIKTHASSYKAHESVHAVPHKKHDEPQEPPAPPPAPVVPDVPVPTLAAPEPPPETVRVWDNSSGMWKDMANPIKRPVA